MSKRTSINLHKSVLALFDEIVDLTDLTFDEIVEMILRRLVWECRGGNHRHLQQVKYQKRDIGKYNIVPLKLSDTAYEYFLDIRHNFRKSSSYQLSEAVVKYFHLIVSGVLDDVVFPLHDFWCFYIDGVQIWVQQWGKETEKLREVYNYLRIFVE